MAFHFCFAKIAHVRGSCYKFIAPSFWTVFLIANARLEMPLRHFIFASQKTLTFAGAATSLLHPIFLDGFLNGKPRLEMPLWHFIFASQKTLTFAELLLFICPVLLVGVDHKTAKGGHRPSLNIL